MNTNKKTGRIAMSKQPKPDSKKYTMKNRQKFKLKKILIVSGICMATLTIVVAGLIVGFNIYSSGETPLFKDNQGNILKNSVAEWEKIAIGGVDQHLLIRGKDKNNPILLWIHGGPGAPDTTLMLKYNKDLEEDFVMVYWEQRGSGKSYKEDSFNETIGVEQYTNDLLEIADYLRDRYSKDKIYLAGHSWGSIISIQAITKKPEYFHAYIGIGQATDMKKVETNSYNMVLEKARKENNKEAIEELERIDKPPYFRNNIDDLKILVKWIDKLGFYWLDDSLNDKMSRAIISSREYTVENKGSYNTGQHKSLEVLWEKVMQMDLSKDYIKFEIPIYFILGKHDLTMNPSLIENYFESIVAPKKEIYIFENSAHFPQLEEFEKFQKTIRDIKKAFIPLIK